MRNEELLEQTFEKLLEGTLDPKGDIFLPPGIHTVRVGGEGVYLKAKIIDRSTNIAVTPIDGGAVARLPLWVGGAT